MPIANCFIKNRKINQDGLNQLVNDWAESINVATEDISLNFITDFIQAGQSYEVMVNLYLPALWAKDEVNKIQKQLLGLLMKYFDLKASEIFIITNIIQSGNVVENGQLVEWE